MNSIKKDSNILVLFEKNQKQCTFDDLSSFQNVIYKSFHTFSTGDHSKYDAVLIDYNSTWTPDLFTPLQNTVKPGGLIVLRYKNEDDSLEFFLKTHGFINVSTEKINSSDNDLIYETKTSKPAYDVGSAKKLNIAKPVVWKLDDDEEEVETIDPDNLLDDEDFNKPDESTLRVCSTTGKRKACRDCSCGLAQELASEKVSSAPVNTAQAKSSCGSCYLGDAFRCATCPYLGMPAFKPGEKVQLNDGLLKADV